MKTPEFWGSKNLLSNLLMPFAHAYDIVSTLRRAYAKPVKLPIPVICIGNLTAGGSGKTPVALAIGEMLKKRGINAYFLSRGYGGKLKGPVRVKLEKHTALDVGDEPLLLAQVLPTIVAKDRVSGAQFAHFKGAQVIVMDDGFQNPFLAKSLSLIVIDGRVGFGNRRILPAGPLREDPDLGFRRTHAVIILNRTSFTPKLPPDLPAFGARTEPQPEMQALKGQKVIAFCGIAYPQKFFDMLASVGANVIERVSFADHQPFKETAIRKLVLRAHETQALLVTTSKDAARLPKNLQSFVYIANIRVVFDNDAAIEHVLDYVLKPNEPEKNQTPA